MRKRLLIIEDDFDVAELLTTYFQYADFEVAHGANGRDGVELARLTMPHVILLDVMLPDIDGYDVCTTLRQVALTRYIPIIFLTQRGERADKVAGLSLGADDYVTKPFDIEELCLRVNGVIDRAGRECLHERRTGLPTGCLVHDERIRRRETGESGLELALVIEHFEEFRDVFGFMAADELFSFAGHVVTEAVKQVGTTDDFIGVEGDAFMLMTYSEEPVALVEEIRRNFVNGARAFYPDVELQHGGVATAHGTRRSAATPLMVMQAYAYN
ncbi:MAG: response regulator [Chloroflexi bacterium]|nr:response regulator [Chloroflexota bacterium]